MAKNTQILPFSQILGVARVAKVAPCHAPAGSGIPAKLVERSAPSFFCAGSLYNGFFFACVGVFFYRALYFGLYDNLKSTYLGENPAFGSSFILAWAVTVFSGLVVYPVDHYRKQLIFDTIIKSKDQFDWRSINRCNKQVFINEGAMSLRNGFGANAVRGVAGAGVLAGYDVLKDIYFKFKLEI